MSALAHMYGEDFALCSGGIKIVSGAEETRQRLLRSLLTNPGEDIWHLDFGLGLRKMVGEVAVPSLIEGQIQAKVVQDPGVDAGIPVEVRVRLLDGGVCQCRVSYGDVESGGVQVIDFSTR